MVLLRASNLDSETHLERIVQVLEHLDLGLGAISPEIHAAQSDTDVRGGRAAAENEDDALILEKALDPHERLGSREVDAYKQAAGSDRSASGLRELGKEKARPTHHSPC